MIERDRVGALDYTVEAAGDGAGFKGIDIGAQMMTGYAGETLSRQDIFGGHLLGLVQSAPDGGLGYAKRGGHSLLR